MVDIPHLALPVRFVGGAAVTVEQDSTDEIAQCVETILRYRPGQRPELPDFGVADPTFQMAPIDLDRARAAVLEWEPRARTIIELVDQAIGGR